jgi:hypothetical protein
VLRCGTGQFGAVAAGIVQDTTNVLFRDLWLQPDLAPRRSKPNHGQRAHRYRASGSDALSPQPGDDNGLMQAVAAELISHLAHYVGWPNALGVAGPKGGHREARQTTYVTLRTPVETMSPHFSRRVAVGRMGPLDEVSFRPRVLAALPRRPCFRIGPGRAQGAF